MNVPIIPAKLSIPTPAASYLPRPRLDRRWRGWSGSKLIQITAGAGYGKTALIAANVAWDDRQCIWYTFDELDNDPSCFHAHMVEAGRRLGRNPLPEGITGHPGEATRILSHILLALQERQSRVLFVFDDVQHVMNSDEVKRTLEQLIRFLPPGNTVVLAAREPLALHTSRLRAAGDLVTVGAADLAFTEDEVEAFQRHRYPEAAVDRRMIRTVTSKTEGWAVGVEMVYQLAGDPTPIALQQALDQLSASGSGWFGYFAEEVIGRLDADTRDFLLQASLLPHLDGEMCNRLFGREDSQERLRRLHERHLFTYTVGDEGGVYCLHNLFRTFLQEQLRASLDERQYRRLLRRAADALADAGAWAEAAATYARAGDPQATLSLIEKRGEELLAAGRYHVLAQAFETLPAGVLAKRVKARILYSRLLEIRGEWDDALAHYKASLRASRPGVQQVALMGYLARFHMRLGRYGATRSLCKRALQARGARDANVRAQLHTTLGLAEAELGRFDDAETHFERSHAICTRTNDEVGQGRATFLLAVNVYLPRGEFARARDAARRAEKLFRRLGDRRLICHTQGVHAYVLAATGKEREARHLAEDGLRQSEALGYRMTEGYSHCTLGRCALLTGDLQAAREHFETARRLGEELREADLRMQPRLGLAEVALAEGNPHAAQQAAVEALEIATGLKDRLQEAQSCTLLGLIAERGQSGSRSSRKRARNRRSATRDRSGKPGAAEDLPADVWWQRAERICRRIGARFDHHRALFYRLSAEGFDPPRSNQPWSVLLTGCAELEHDQLFLSGAPPRSTGVLVEALRRGVEPAYAGRLLVRLGNRAVPFLETLARDGSDEARALATDILAQIGGPEAQAALERMAQQASPSGQAARRVIEELREAPGAPLHIQALGPFIMAVEDRALPYGAWRSKRALRMLQLMLAHRFRWVPREEVMEALWPEAEPEKAENNLRQTAHILRRTLEPDLKETRRSRHVRFRNGAWRLDPGDGHTYDVAAFDALIRHADEARRSDRPRKAAEGYREALSLYRGDFLTESPYDEFIDAERGRLRDRFSRGVSALLKLHTSGRRWDEIIPLARRGLRHDPYRESYHWHLVHALLRKGHRREAADAYMAYEHELLRELGVLPSADMRKLADALPRMGANRPQRAAAPLRDDT